MPKTKRRNQNEIIQLYNAVIQTIDALGPPVTLRQLYYAMLPLNLYPKTEQAYKSLSHHTVKMREMGLIGYNKFSDNTRWQRKPRTYNGLDEFLEITAQTYRRALWADMDCYVELWSEKDAMASLFYDITAPYDVPLMVNRGYSSATFAYEAAEAIKRIGKETFIYYFGDFDPSGVQMAQDLERKLRGHGAEIYFERVSVNEDQISKWKLPTRPTKKTDSRAAKFGHDFSVELDAVPPSQLRDLIKGCIERHLPAYEWERLKQIEREERATLNMMRQSLVPDGSEQDDEAIPVVAV